MEYRGLLQLFIWRKLENILVGSYPENCHKEEYNMGMNKKELYTKAFKKLVECGEIDKYTTRFAVMYNPKTDIMDVIVYAEDFGETEEYGKF